MTGRKKKSTAVSAAVTEYLRLRVWIDDQAGA